jgi:hypothetical protein
LLSIVLGIERQGWLVPRTLPFRAIGGLFFLESAAIEKKERRKVSCGRGAVHRRSQAMHIVSWQHADVVDVRMG